MSVEDRSADTLIPIIKKHVLPGTIIISDCWKAYSKLEEEGFQHQTVNHSKEFINKETGAHTNTIESTWRAVKTSLPKHGTVKSLYDTRALDLRNLGPKFGPIPKAKKYVFFPILVKKFPI